MWIEPFFALYLLFALSASSSLSEERLWVVVSRFAWVALLMSIAGLLHFLTGFAGPDHALGALDVIGITLANALGVAVVRYSARYLRGEPGQHRYVRYLGILLAAVNTLFLTDDIFVLVLAWFLTSLCLYQLLLFYPDRRAAQIAAHKKFIASRLGDICLLTGAAILVSLFGTSSMSEMNALSQSAEFSSQPLVGGMILFCLGVIFKTAQLPVHGWLMQVMEAPTPVSALLHAGVVNIGGFALLRLGGVLSFVPEAQVVLVIVGSLTAVLAGMIMLTRVSVKVRLAWSTCSQMGFMLVECGLGFYELALLHFIGHSIYKAHAFLSAGETVREARKGVMAEVPHERGDSFTPALLALLAPFVAWGMILGALQGWQLALLPVAIPVTVQLLLALGLAPFFWDLHRKRFGTHFFAACSVFLLINLYLAWHLVMHGLLAGGKGELSGVIHIFVATLFFALYLCQAVIRLYPESFLSRKLYPWFFAGLYLDELFTRFTFWSWPPPPLKHQSHGAMMASAEFREVRHVY